MKYITHLIKSDKSNFPLKDIITNFIGNGLIFDGVWGANVGLKILAASPEIKLSYLQVQDGRRKTFI